MAATAVAQPARRAPARTTAPPARRPASRRRARRPAPAPKPRGLAALADARLIVRLTQSQAWIAMIGVLLAGIVAVNVINLGMSAGLSSTAERAAELEQRNSLLRERIGSLRRNTKIETSAAKIGLGQPSSSELVRVSAKRGDAQRAAERLTTGLGSGVVAPVAAQTSTETVTDPATAEPVVEPEAAASVATAETATETTATEQVAATPPPTDTAEPAAAAGGVAP